MAGRRTGAPNYKNNILIAIIEELLPNGRILWEVVAERYQLLSGEAELRNVDDLKKHWHFKLCNKLNKPTGRTGENGDRILRCIRIHNAITAKSDSVLLGVDDSCDECKGPSEEDSDEEEGGDDEDDDRKPAAIDDATLAAVIEDSYHMNMPPALPTFDIGAANLLGSTSVGAVIAGASAAATLTNGSAAIGSAATAAGAYPGTGSSTAAIGSAATAGAYPGTAATPATTSFKPKKVKPANEKTKNSSNVAKDRFSIRKTLDKLTDAFCTPSASTTIHPHAGLETYQNSLDRMVRNEIDRQIDVHSGYVRDLRRRTRETNRMLKRLMREFKNDKRKAKKAKGEEGKNGKGGDGTSSDDDSSSDSDLDE